MNALRNLKIGKKLMILMLIFVLSLIAFGGTSYQLIKQMNNNSIIMYKESLLHVEGLNQLLSSQRATDSYLLELILSNDDNANNLLFQNINQASQEQNTLIKEYEQSGISPYEQSILIQYKDIREQYQKALQNVIDLAMKNLNQEAYLNYKKNIPLLTNNIDALLKELTMYNSVKANELSQSNQQSFKRATIIMVVILSVSLALQRSLKTVDKLLKLVYAESGIRSLGTSKTGRMQHVRLLDKPAAYCREVERLSTSFIRLG